METNALALAADIGGTFTDVVLADRNGSQWTTKQPTTHHDPIDGVVAGVEEVLNQAAAQAGDVTRFVHGTTLATNVILERTGAKVALLITEGFGSLLELGRQARAQDERTDLFWSPAPPPVPRERTFEIPERTGPDGEVVRPLDEAAVADVVDRLAGLDVDAVCLLHAYARPAHEQRVAELCRAGLPDDVLVVTSCEVLPQMREHDRTATTVMSAIVSPVMSAYLRRLERRQADLGIPAPVYVMSSSAEALSAEVAARRAIATVESGPAAGVLAAQWLHMAFDFGGSGARRGADGIDAAGGLFGGGHNLVPQIEPIEAALPLRFESVELIEDSGGQGQWRGGRGTRTVIRLLDDALVDTRGDRLRIPPPGLDGGGPGRPGSYRRRRPDGSEEVLPTKATSLRFEQGDALVIETSGGGGLGTPPAAPPAG